MLTAFQQETIPLSHEVAESITDPNTQTGWLDASGGRDRRSANVALGHARLRCFRSLVAGGRPGGDSHRHERREPGGERHPDAGANGVSFSGLVATVADPDQA